ncbi:MAG: hypothetical protein IJY39_06055 [Clostridia bacterium]|nr:hypothetical protein [Clostridia bacterium]
MSASYIIRKTENMNSHTDIGRIGIIKHTGDEWICFKKRFTLDTLPDFAAIRFDSVGVCGAYVNGAFVGTNTGRYANRISCAECRSLLKLGENEIALVLGGHYYQTVERDFQKRRGSQFSCVAAELEINVGEKELKIATDESWLCESDDGQTKPQVFTQVTQGEYDRFWLSAALWREEKEISVPDAVAKVAEGYQRYVSRPKQTYAYPSSIRYTNMEMRDDCLVSAEEKSHVMYEFDRLYCGYVCLECIAEDEGEVELRFDYTTYPEDLEFETPQHNISAKRLTLKSPLKKGENKLFLLRRRAAKYVKLLFNTKVTLKSFGFRLDLINHEKQGYFHCSEEIFNKMWEVGKYTLHINKHQEYESCPRNEMKYFTGDGIIAALIDAYAFGDGDLTVSSLSYTEMTSNVGRITDRFMRNVGLWEYPAWRIVHAYNHYFYYNDTHLAEQHFEELASNLDWMIGKMNASDLIYQFPVFSGAFCFANSSVDFTQSLDRLGEKPLINALLYKSLICMAELADVVGDQRAKEWRTLAEKVKKAINDRLWSEEKQAYLDTFDQSYVPQDGNALCVLYGIAEGDRADAAMRTLRKQLWSPYGATVIDRPDPHQYGGNDTVSPLMNTYEAEARFLMGDSEGALELMDRCFGGMLRKGTETFWEYCPATDAPKPKYFTNCHAWSAGCTYVLSAYVLGIRPEKAGYEVVRFEPCDRFDSFEGVVPTPQGLIAVSCKTADGKKTYSLAIPCGMKYEAHLPESAALTVTEYRV